MASLTEKELLTFISAYEHDVAMFKRRLGRPGLSEKARQIYEERLRLSERKLQAVTVTLQLYQERNQKGGDDDKSD